MLVQVQVLRQSVVVYAAGIPSPTMTEYQHFERRVLAEHGRLGDGIRTVSQDSKFFDSGAGVIDRKTRELPVWIPFEDRPAMVHAADRHAAVEDSRPPCVIQDEFDRLLAGASLVERKMRGEG